MEKPCIFTWKELRQKIREKSLDQAAAGLIALALLCAGFFGRSLLDKYRRWRTDRTNLTVSSALDEAHELIGSRIAGVIPFKNKGNPEQFILVAQEHPSFPNEGWDSGDPVYLLEGIAGAYQIRNLDIGAEDILAGTNGAASMPLWGVIDIDGDGSRQVYVISRSGGSGYYSFTLRVYDTRENATYDAESDGQYGDTNSITLTPNASNRPKLKAWLSATARQLIAAHSDKIGTNNYEVEEWRKKNGDDFEEGKVIIQEYPGKIPPTEGGYCLVDDGQYKWVSFNKGAVFAYDKGRDVHFVVYKPGSDYNSPYSIISGQDYVWFDNDNHDVTSLAFNKTTHILGHPPQGSVDATSEFAHAVSDCSSDEKL